MSHLKSVKHIGSKDRRSKEKKRQQALSEALKARDQEARPVGEMLPLENRAYRVTVMESFVREGIPLSKVNDLWDLLEGNSLRLCYASHLSEYIPLILQEEKRTLKEEIAGKFVSVIFDGTTRLGEAIAIVLRYVDEKLEIHQRLVRLRTVAKSINAPQLAQVLNECLCVDYQIHGKMVIAAMRDGVAVNGAAIRHLQVLLPQLLDIICFSHTLNNTGRHVNLPVLEEFGQLWVTLFSHSHRAKLAWKARTGSSMKSYSNTRRWSKWELYQQVATYFGDVKPFLEPNGDISPVTSRQLLAIVAHAARNATLRMELAAVVDYGKPLVKATYQLEGDGALVLLAYECL